MKPSLFFLDIALLNNDDEAYELLNSLEALMNRQTEENDLVSITSEEFNDRAVEDATETFLEAALTGNINLLTSLYESGTKVVCYIIYVYTNSQMYRVLLILL